MTLPRRDTPDSSNSPINQPLEDEGEDSSVADSIPDLFADVIESQEALSNSAGGVAGNGELNGDLDPDDHNSEFDFGLGAFDDNDTWTSNASKRWNRHVPTKEAREWFPYPSKAMFLADLLFSCRRLHFSRPQMMAILEFARECGGNNVPSLCALQKLQEDLKDMANPQVRPHMNFFPHIDGKRMSQAWQGNKMVHDVSDHYLTPCIRVNGRIFYVNELVRRQNDWFIPLRWITHGPHRELRAIGHLVTETESGLNVHRNRRAVVRVSTFLQSFPEMQASGQVPRFNDQSKSFEANMLNQLREIAGSRPIYSIPLIIFMDDASGNVSKQWNKHWSCYLSNAALPREVLQSKYNVRFVATSSHASPSELMHGIRASIEEAFKNPIVAFDSLTGQEVLIRPFPLFWAGDNPMQAEHCSSSGLNSSHFCRTCDVGGTNEFKRSIEGYPTLFKSGNRRIPSKTREIVDKRLEMALKPRMIVKIQEHARDSGIKDSVAQTVIDRLLALGKSLQKPTNNSPPLSPEQIEEILRRELDLARRESYMNPLLDMQGVDIHRDTPTEVLHTVLLGVVKYYWEQSVHLMGRAKQMPAFESRLASVGLSGLDVPTLSARYICTYHGSLIGKHFKTLVQIMPFLTFDFLPHDVFNAWLLLGRLTSLLWYTEIDNIDSYTDELEKTINDFLTITASCSPSIMLLKPKFHFLVHLPSYIRRFGPALLFSTERFESFNGVFRAASMLSNRQAPSHDIARRFANIDRAKHIVSGGYWREGSGWVRANDTLLRFTTGNTIFSKLIGLPSNNIPRAPGSIYLRATASLQTWSLFSKRAGIAHAAAPGARNDRYRPAESESSFGRVKAIFSRVSPTGSRTYFAAVQNYAVGTKHPLFDMPTATLGDPITCVQIQDIQCLVNTQHDCAADRKCTSTRAVFEVQEREQTSRVHYCVQHSNDCHFLINTQGFHNSQRIRNAIPSEVYCRTPLTIDRQEVFRSAVKKMGHAKAQKDKLATARREARAIVTGALADSPTEDPSEPDPQLQHNTPQPKRKASSSVAGPSTRKRARRVNSADH